MGTICGNGQVSSQEALRNFKRQREGGTHRSCVQVPVYIVVMKRSSQCARCVTAERLQPERHLVSGILLRTHTWT
jgi:hypothetical protein